VLVSEFHDGKIARFPQAETEIVKIMAPLGFEFIKRDPELVQKIRPRAQNPREPMSPREIRRYGYLAQAQIAVYGVIHCNTYTDAMLRKNNLSSYQTSLQLQVVDVNSGEIIAAASKNVGLPSIDRRRGIARSISAGLKLAVAGESRSDDASLIFQLLRKWRPGRGFLYRVEILGVNRETGGRYAALMRDLPDMISITENSFLENRQHIDARYQGSPASLARAVTRELKRTGIQARITYVSSRLRIHHAGVKAR